MKDKSWIIILIMGIALAISLGYSIVVSQKTKNIGESTVTTTSIIEMKASTVTIKNTLTGVGNVEYKEIEKDENNNNIEQQNENVNNETTVDEQNQEKIYQIVLSIEDKNLEKAKIGQDVEISVKKDEENFNYTGKVIKINKDINNKSTLTVEIINPDERLGENMQANCTVIVEKAENVVGLPVEAVQKDDEGKEYVDVVQEDGSAKQVYIKTGISDDYYVEITYGLNVGDSVQIVKSTTTVVNKNKGKDNNNINAVSEM